MSLLSKAKAVPLASHHRRGAYTREEIELAIAWAAGIVTVKQVAGAIGKPMDTGTYAFLAHALRAGHAAGMWREV